MGHFLFIVFTWHDTDTSLTRIVSCMSSLKWVYKEPETIIRRTAFSESYTASLSTPFLLPAFQPCSQPEQGCITKWSTGAIPDAFTGIPSRQATRSGIQRNSHSKFSQNTESIWRFVSFSIKFDPYSASPPVLSDPFLRYACKATGSMNMHFNRRKGGLWSAGCAIQLFRISYRVYAAA